MLKCCKTVRLSDEAVEDPAVAGGWAACGPMGVLNVDDAGAGADDADDADADAVTNAVASALGSKTFANISVIRFIVLHAVDSYSCRKLLFLCTGGRGNDIAGF